jgi:hypothetical protein
LDIAIAGGLAITVTTTDVTLTITQGTSVATNIGSTTAQYAILNVSGAMTAARNLILPSSSRQYVINNACTGGFLLTVKGSATSGVTLVNGEKAHVFWNGSDYAKLSNAPGGAGTFSSITNTGLTSGRVVYSTTGGLETDSANLTFDGTNLTLLGGTANGVAFLNGSKVLTSGSALTFDGTNLALGTTINALRKVNILSGAGVTALAAVGPAGYLLVDNTGSGENYFQANSANIWQGTGGTEQMRLTSTGLGIGTSSPAYPLQVRRAGGAGSVGITIDNVTGVADRTTQYFALGDSTSSTTGHAFYTRAATASDVLRLAITSSGDVGIGTSSPKAKLHTNAGNVSTVGAIASSGLMIENFSGVGNVSQIGFGYSPGATNTGAYITYINNSAVGFGYGDIAFGTRTVTTDTVPTERMRIDSSGNVGIGTSSPADKLQVEGNIYLGTTSRTIYQGSSADLTLQVNTGNIKFFRANGVSESMRIDSSGNVGIGTSSIGARLQVSSGATALATYVASTATSAYSATSYNGANALLALISGGASGAFNGIRMSQGGSSELLFAQVQEAGGASAFVFQGYNGSAYAERMRIDSSGNLLVGTTDTSLTSGVGLKFIASATHPFMGYVSSTSSQSDTNYHLYSTSAAAFRFYVSTAGTVYATSIVITAISDQRLKENVRDIDTGLNAIMALKPRRFDWKEGKGQDKKNVAGFIAQEFEDVFPESVGTTKAGGDGIEYKNINHETLIPTLVKAIQEQQALITSLTARIAALEST